jgi:tRNA threonylcarbamoyladenosine biosynthesis protein TsaE
MLFREYNRFLLFCMSCVKVPVILINKARILMKHIFYNAKETENFANNFAKRKKQNDIICLYGKLGAGKTVFARGLCRGLGYGGAVTSPTFTLMNVYEGGRLTVYHFDLYRLQNASDLESIGYEEYLNAGGVCLVEWPEQGGADWPQRAYRIEIRTDLTKGENVRELVVYENISD